MASSLINVSTHINVYPETGCEYIVGLDNSEKLVLVQREIRGGFQSPRPNFEGRGEFQSPRLSKVQDLYFSPIIAEINHNERPQIITPIPRDPIQSDAKQSDAKQSDAKQSDAKQSDPKQSDPKRKSPITINTINKNNYREAILTDEYDDNHY
jgi:hypothetical protein